MRILFFLGSLAFGQQSLQLSTSVHGTASLAGGAYSGLPTHSMRYETRWWGANIAAGNNSGPGSIGPITLVVINANQLWVEDFYDDVVSNGCAITWAGYTDTKLRWQRTITGSTGTLSLEAFQTSTGASLGQCVATITAVAQHPISSFASLGVSLGGDASTTGNLDFARFYSSTVALGTSIPVAAGVSTGDYLDYEFNGNLTDASANANTLTLAGASFLSTPAFPPSCNIPQQSFSLSFTVLLDASSCIALNGSTPLTYAWSYAGAGLDSSLCGSQTPTFQTPTAVTTTVTGLIACSFNVQLLVTDSSTNASTIVTHHGVVSTNLQHSVNIPPWANRIIRKAIQYGYASVTGSYAACGNANCVDYGQKTLADYWGAKLSTDSLPVWNTAKSGTISLCSTTSGGGCLGTAVIGVGTHFATEFAVGDYLVIWYPYPGQGGSGGRRAMHIDAIADDTHLTIHDAYYFGDSISGLQYGRMTNSQVGDWINQSTNFNYYDNVKAFLSFYLRSGIDVYFDYGKTLADHWWSMPWIDQGTTLDLNTGTWALAPRMLALQGMMLRANMPSGHANWWAGPSPLANNCNGYPCSGLRGMIRAMYSNWVNIAPNGGAGGSQIDNREEGYALDYHALGALLDPDATSAADFASKVSTGMTTNWIPSIQVDGSVRDYDFAYSTWNSGVHFNLTHNNSVVTAGTSTTFTSGLFGTNIFVVCNGNPGQPPRTNADCDPVAYTPTFIDSTHFDLGAPYAGSNATDATGYIGNLGGVGTEVFMMGIVGSGLANASRVTTGATQTAANNAVVNLGTWIKNVGYDALAGGIYYGVAFVNCGAVPAPGNVNCEYGVGSRTLSPEAFPALGEAYERNQNPSFRAVGDSLLSNAFDGSSAPSCWDPVNIPAAKWFGFCYGIGESWSWDAYRLSAPAISETLHSASSISGAATVK